MTAPWLKTLDEIEGSDLPLVGGKAFNLATLRRHGLPVPNGLVVTTAFFEAQLKHHQFIPLWAGSPDVAVTEGALCWLADALKVTPLARELMAALNERLAETFPQVESFAVRSSAIDEDVRDHAFSGIHLSELGVPRPMVPVSLSRCWASALSKPALQYRQQHGLSIQSIRVAVLIQPYVQPQAAGVAFTLNPLSGARDELVVEATFGPGSPVVSGQVTPYRYRLAKHPPDYPLIQRTPGDPPHPEGAARATPNALPSEGSNQRARGNPLTTSQLQTLAQYLEQIEALMTVPQDVEWALAAESPQDKVGFLFLQTRPITVLPDAATSLDVEWSRANQRELLPDLPSPLCASLMERTQDRALLLFRQLGFNLENVGPYLKIILGRPYLNLTLARRLLAQSGLSATGLLWVIGHTEPPRDPGATYAIDWRRVWRARRPLFKLGLHSLRLGARLRRFERLVGEVHRTLRTTDWANASPTALLNRFHLHTRLGNRMNETDLLLSAARVAAAVVAGRVLAPVADEADALIRDAVHSSWETTSTRHGRWLLKLATVARADEQVWRYLADAGDDFNQYRQALADTPFLAAFDQFLAQHSEHALFEADPGWPRYGEDPSALLAQVAHLAGVAKASDVGKALDRRNRAARPPAASEAEDALRRLPFWRRWLARLAVRGLRRLTRMRRRLRALYGQAMTDCRAWDLKLGERWVARGWLVRPEDLFWLTMEEIERGLMAEDEVGPTLPALVRARRETYQAYAATEMPYTLRQSDVARLVPGRGLAGTALSSVLSGLPVSPGQVQGRIVVLRRPEDFDRMQKGAILVTPSTDPAWFPIFPQARGLIVETGGLLSHGSIIAREFGLPAVANIPQATRRFHDGDLVLLDGSTGLVQILEPGPNESQ